MPSSEPRSSNMFQAALSAFARLVRRKPQEELVVDEEGVRRLRGGEVFERLRWAQLTQVAIATTDDGPFVEDFFWLLREADGSGCAVPAGQAQAMQLLKRLQKLPRFDDDIVIIASASTSNALFVCWEGEPGEGAVCAREPGER